MSGGASYVLSREALRRFMTQAYDSGKICPEPKKMGIEDFYMGICLQNVGVHLIDSARALSKEDKPKFFPLDVQSYLYNFNASIPDWLREMSVSQIATVRVLAFFSTNIVTLFVTLFRATIAARITP